MKLIILPNISKYVFMCVYIWIEIFVCFCMNVYVIFLFIDTFLEKHMELFFLGAKGITNREQQAFLLSVFYLFKQNRAKEFSTQIFLFQGKHKEILLDYFASDIASLLK